MMLKSKELVVEAVILAGISTSKIRSLSCLEAEKLLEQHLVWRNSS
jgi:hypothetical protein